MKILLAIDGSPHSQAALDEVASRDWPAGTEVEIVTVIHTKWPVVGDPVFFVASAHADSLHQQRQDAPRLLERAVEQIGTGRPQLSVTTKTLEGVPHEAIVREAEDFGADLIVLDPMATVQSDEPSLDWSPRQSRSRLHAPSRSSG